MLYIFKYQKKKYIKIIKPCKKVTAFIIFSMTEKKKKENEN